MSRERLDPEFIAVRNDSLLRIRALMREHNIDYFFGAMTEDLVWNEGEEPRSTRVLISYNVISFHDESRDRPKAWADSDFWRFDVVEAQVVRIQDKPIKERKGKKKRGDRPELIKEAAGLETLGFRLQQLEEKLQEKNR